MFMATVVLAPRYTQAPQTSMPRKPSTTYWYQTAAMARRSRHSSARAMKVSKKPASAQRPKASA